MKTWISSFIVMALLFSGRQAGAVLHFAEDISIYETAPTGNLADSGWQFQGQFEVKTSNGYDAYLGTPIAPHHFITAAHLPNANIGDVFIYNGREYETINFVKQPGTDLILWEVDGTFESYAPLYTGSGEAGRPLVVFGRGVDRGDVVTSVSQVMVGRDKGQPVYEDVTITNGWKWGAYSYTQRWGENSVHSIYDNNGQELLLVYWDADGGANEAMLADKDSGGAVFIEDGGTWKLAGINYSVGPSLNYSQDPSGSPSFKATILDFRGDIYSDTGSDYSDSQQSYFFSSRISSSYAWITNSIPDFDSDLDQLPDWWESQTGQGDADADPDLDGFTNLEEYIANTNPNDGTSLPEITEWQAPTNVIFNSSADREYIVEFRETMNSGEAWQTEVDWFPGAEGVSSVPVSDMTSNRFYRIRVRL
jgi:hypothetical protein